MRTRRFYIVFLCRRFRMWETMVCVPALSHLKKHGHPCTHKSARGNCSSMITLYVVQRAGPMILLPLCTHHRIGSTTSQNKPPSLPPSPFPVPPFRAPSRRPIKPFITVKFCCFSCYRAQYCLSRWRYGKYDALGPSLAGWGSEIRMTGEILKARWAIT